ncbi:hypothetical protein [Alloactinosynnema sp. L-07]|uniref:hypothetical protein n=1 Tax=Alloactinosynnema sp. L-07 TaxID=1653480 RepID=UPI00065F0647|nr:hypothetical protein [Alloactinosynnema sp. L-07]CRK59097.1 hypothetical protein [Alloactinosynnema sp. L-07]
MHAVIDTITGQRICLTPDLDRAEAAAVSEQHVVVDAWDARHLLWYVKPGSFADRFEPYQDELQRLVFGRAVDRLVGQFRRADPPLDDTQPVIDYQPDLMGTSVRDDEDCPGWPQGGDGDGEGDALDVRVR